VDLRLRCRGREGTRVKERVALAVVALAVLIGIGSWERESRADEQSDGMRRVLSEVGPLDGPDLRGFRIFTNFECLVYERGRNDFALEVCVDEDGRVVEAIDRRDGSPEIWSVRDDPTRSEVRVDRTQVDELLDRMMV
jgi:hypothetical protein